MAEAIEKVPRRHGRSNNGIDGLVKWNLCCAAGRAQQEGEGLTAGKSAKAPTLRDMPDRELCLSLPYGNPDFAKEAERRELTEKKCKEILGD